VPPPEIVAEILRKSFAIFCGLVEVFLKMGRRKKKLLPFSKKKEFSLKEKRGVKIFFCFVAGQNLFFSARHFQKD